MKVLFFLILMFGLVGCSEQTLTQQDDNYYKSMAKIFNELDASFVEFGPSFESYVNDASRSNPKALNAPAEKLRKKIISLTKQIEKLKPPTSGMEGNQSIIISSMNHYKDFSETLIRISNGNDKDDGLLRKAKSDFDDGSATYKMVASILTGGGVE